VYETWAGLELTSFLFLLVIAWIAGKKASGLLYSPSAQQAQRKTRKQLHWIIYTTLFAILPIVPITMLYLSFDALFWTDRLIVYALLLAIPALFVLFGSAPALLKIRKALRSSSGAALDSQVRHHMSRPGFIVPFYAVALGALFAFYFRFVPPVPFELLGAAIPVALYLLAVVALWNTHRRRSSQASAEGAILVRRPWIRTLRSISVVAVLLVAGTVFLYFAHQSSLLPGSISMMAGSADYGGGTKLEHDHSQMAMTGSKGMVSVTKLTGPATGKPDRQFTLTAEKATVTLSSGESVDAWTYNGQIPGPELRMKEGELIEVTLLNKDMEQGVTLHWHGLDVPNAEDGVAGATQNAVMPGEKHVYRFLAEQVGTFWYHSHQDSQEAVQRGLFGSLIVEPKEQHALPEKDITVITHNWPDAGLAIGSSDEVQRMKLAPGTKVRLRLINTDDWTLQKYTLAGAAFQVAAIDGTDLNGPGDLTNSRVTLPTGGRADLTFVMPSNPVYLSVGNRKDLGILMSPDGSGDIPSLPTVTEFDPTHYGISTATPFDANSKFDRQFEMVLDNKLGFYNGSFNSLYTINGEVFPNTPMFMVKEGELIKMTISNRGFVDHPMHLHGHHVLVLSRNGEPATGSPWWSDTLSVVPGETYEVAFRADNPGVWMDHCHNLVHAKTGMTMHLSYEGVTSPFEIGADTHNHPE
jgi:FtsP/CotA-like multicopper oxidase with cupredoxin domain